RRLRAPARRDAALRDGEDGSDRAGPRHGPLRADVREPRRRSEQEGVGEVASTERKTRAAAPLHVARAGEGTAGRGPLRPPLPRWRERRAGPRGGPPPPCPPPGGGGACCRGSPGPSRPGRSGPSAGEAEPLRLSWRGPAYRGRAASGNVADPRIALGSL